MKRPFQKLPPWLSPYALKLLLFLILLLLVTSVGFYVLELVPKGNTDFFSAVWWAVVTLTTVGYGDMVPVTPLGRLLGVGVMVTGIGLVATLTGNFASFLVEQKTKKRKGLLKVSLDNHTLILGWNGYGPSLVAGLKERGCVPPGHLVLVNTLAQEQREELSVQLDLDDHLHFVSGNPAQEAVVERAAPATARLAFILSQEDMTPEEADRQCLYTALTLHSKAPKLMLVAEVAKQENREHLLRAGVGEVIVRGELATRLMGCMGQSAAVYHFVQHLLAASGEDVLRYRDLTPEEKKMAWKDVFDTLRQKHRLLPLALCRERRSISLNDILAEASPLDDFIRELFASSGRNAPLGTQLPRVLVNPPDDQDLAGFDGIISLDAGKRA